jgi:hypothetical protein
MILCHDVWHITNDNFNRYYFDTNRTTYICRGDTANENGFVVYSSGATGYAYNLVIKNNGCVGIGNPSPWEKLNIRDCSVANSNGAINFGKRDATGRFKNFKMEFNDFFCFLIGDNGNLNNNINT